ncbi:Histone acetyltransferase [Phytophthora rubi]|uniref:histone acetyltransferase n=1 Tax=Phytophthora rubi TaxID=129364 RepID=A0A6A3P154_9STRA|nr:Histone acetyltransferase [Phytophthora rubi]
MNMNSDNRFMSQFNLGGGGNVNGGGMGGMDLSGGLDFSGGMNLMADSSLMLGGNTSAPSAGLIDFPDELNSPPTTASSGPSSSSMMMDTSSSMMTASSAPMSSTADAIPFPASLAAEPLSNSSTTASSSAGLDVMNFMNSTTTSSAMGNNGNAGNGMGMDMNSMGMNMGMNSMGMGMGMNNMGMDMSGNSFGMNDANQMMFNNMQQMNMMNPQGSYYMPQQQMQQQHYMQMMHQQRLKLQRQQQQQQKALLERQRLAQQQQAQKNSSNQQAQQQQAAQQKQQQMLAAGQVQPQMTAQRQLSGGNTSMNATANANPARTQSQAPSQNTGAATGGTRPTWQSSADQALRKEMLNHIMRVLQNQRSNAPANWLQKLPEMAHRLEDECYRIAASREEYANTSTLQSRLRSIVRSAQTHQRSIGANSMRQPGAPNQSPSGNTGSASTASTGAPIPFPGAQAVAPVTNGVNTDVKNLAAQAIQMPPELQDPPSQVNTPVKTESAQAQSRMQSTPVMDSVVTDRSSMSGTGISTLAGQNGVQSTPGAGSANTNGSANGAVNSPASAAAARNKSAQIIWQFKAKAQQVTSALDPNQTTEYHNKLRLMVRDDVKTAGSKEVLQRQQQRLLLLRHAMWCKSPEGTCTTTPSCGEMKRLWAHMGICQQTNACSYSHCISSKYVLSHFQQCTNAKCLVCQVVRYPVEVKEKSGALMLDADRALQQIIAASQRRQRMIAMKKQQEMQQQMQQPQSQPQPQQQQPMPLVMPAHLQQPQNNGNVGAMNFQQPQQNAGQTANHLTPMGANMNSMGMAMSNGSNRSVSMPTVQSNPAGVGSNGMMGQQGPVKAENTPGQPTNLVPDDQRQLQLIKQKLAGRSLEQLTGHCLKLEKWVEEIRARMNAIMNECRQLLHLSNSTQDPMQKSHYEAQVQEKRVMLKQLDVKFKQCRSQRNIVKHVIDERNATAAMPTQNGMMSTQAVPNGSAGTMQPIPMPTQMQQQNLSQQMQAHTATAPGMVPKPSPDDLLGEEDMDVPTKVENDLAVAGKPLEMPMDLQDTTATPVSVAAPLNTLTAPQQLMNNNAAMGGPRPGLTMNHAQNQGYGQNQGPMQQSGKAANLQTVPTSSGAMIKQEVQVKSDTAGTGTATTSMKTDASAVKEEIAINPLTMNNSKLNAMMVEHRRMDASTNLPLPAGAVGTPKALSSDTSSNTAGAAAPAPPASSEVPMSVLSELSNEDLASHIDSLVTYYNATVSPANLKKKLEAILKGMMDHKFGWVFNTPVDPVALNIPNYFKIIRKPMDLGTVKKKLEVGIYKHIEEFARDVRNTFENAMQYNSEDQDVYSLAKDMMSDFNGEMRKLAAEIEVDEKEARAKESSCRLCGIERMVFEPAVLYCNGECNSRIRRNCYYYTSADNKYHCCHQCFGSLPDNIKHNEGRQYKKNELARKKNDEVHEEPWVQCDKCERWVHQICALFNGKVDSEKKPQLVKTEGGQSTDSGDASSSPSPSSTKPTAVTTTTTVVKSSSSSGSKGTVHSITTSPGSEFLCPECLLEHRKSEPEKYKIGRHAFSAKDLQRTKLSDFLERRIHQSLKAEREDDAKWTQRDVKDVETAEGLTVRLVSNIEKQLMVRDKMFQRYKDSHKYTSEHRFKSKCICMFQELDGVSVLLFGMYVHEFDEQEADCNSRRLYISYLDSVNYFKPAHLRTKVYHELLIAYFDFVKQRGFHTAHLWACPPLKGDDYILYCHPEAQKTPKSDRLRAWYVDMLVKAQEEGVVWQITNMYDDYWRNDNTPCALPYCEGDYWVGLAEDLIEKLDAEKPKKIVSKKGSKSQKRKNSDTKKAANKKSKSKKPKRRKTASGGEASGDEEDGDDGHDETSAVNNRTLTVKSLDTPDWKVSDPLMHKLGEVIEPMKDDFLVVKLVPCCRVCNTSVVQGTLWLDHNVKTEHGLNPKVVQTALCDGCYQKLKVVSAAGSSAAHHRLQTRLNALTKETVALPERCTDPDEINDSEFFDTRQAFLSLCQGNHYQFDELRRAKHSSMMALYHLGNPNPNAYVYECNACTRDIVEGNRWHCHTCPDFDVCDACYAKEKHEHPLEKVPTGSTAPTMPTKPTVTAEQRRLREQRAKNVRLHMQLLVHSSSCADGNCGSSNCEKMKELMRHGAQCKQRAYGGCTICRRVWALLQLHARQCRQYECKVPRCHDLREHVRKLQLQQQLMDDRRRAAVTQQYRQMQSERQQEQQNQAQGDEPMPQA